MFALYFSTLTPYAFMLVGVLLCGLVSLKWVVRAITHASSKPSKSSSEQGVARQELMVGKQYHNTGNKLLVSETTAKKETQSPACTLSQPSYDGSEKLTWLALSQQGSRSDAQQKTLRRQTAAITTSRQKNKRGVSLKTFIQGVIGGFIGSSAGIVRGGAIVLSFKDGKNQATLIDLPRECAQKIGWFGTQYSGQPVLTMVHKSDRPQVTLLQYWFGVKQRFDDGRFGLSLTNQTWQATRSMRQLPIAGEMAQGPMVVGNAWGLDYRLWTTIKGRVSHFSLCLQIFHWLYQYNMALRRVQGWHEEGAMAIAKVSRNDTAASVHLEKQRQEQPADPVKLKDVTGILENQHDSQAAEAPGESSDEDEGNDEWISLEDHEQMPTSREVFDKETDKTLPEKGKQMPTSSVKFNKKIGKALSPSEIKILIATILQSKGLKQHPLSLEDRRVDRQPWGESNQPNPSIFLWPELYYEEQSAEVHNEMNATSTYRLKALVESIAATARQGSYSHIMPACRTRAPGMVDSALRLVNGTAGHFLSLCIQVESGDVQVGIWDSQGGTNGPISAKNRAFLARIQKEIQDKDGGLVVRVQENHLTVQEWWDGVNCGFYTACTLAKLGQDPTCCPTNLAADVQKTFHLLKSG